MRLQIKGEQCFLTFTVEAARWLKEEVFRKLLRDGRAALHHMAGGEVLQRGTHHADEIYAHMLTEAAFLDGDKSRRHVRRQIAHVDHRALREILARDQVTVPV